MRTMDLSGRKILITGASSGIGQATAILLDSLGAKTVLCGRNEQRLSQTAEQLSNSTLCIPFDLLNFDEYDRLFAEATADGEKLNGLVHCAGVAKATPLKGLSLQQVHGIMDSNLTSFVMLCAAYAKRKYSLGGSIVGVSAVNAHIPQKCMSVYAASKSAMEAVVRTAALELTKSNIRINCVAPGAVDTAMSHAVDEETLKEIVRHQLLGMCNPEQIASVIAFLLSDFSSAITGRTIYADGGMLGQSTN